MDALGDAGETDWQPPDTGSLLGDLTAIGGELLAGFTDAANSAVPTAVISAAFQSEAAAGALRTFYLDRYRRSSVVVRRAVDRGELPPETDALDVIRASVAPVFHRLFISREPVSDADVRRAAAAAAAGVFDGKPAN